MSLMDDLMVLLKKLRLSGVLQTLDVRAQQATEDNLSHTEFLFRLLSDEVERRDHKQLDQRLRKASFEHKKTLEEFDFAFNPEVPRTKIIDLATCIYVEKNESVLLLGPTGTGKSHLAQALGHRACRAGHAVLYVAASDMLQQLRAARADGSHDRRMLRFTTPKLLIIDDLGLRPLSGEEPLDLSKSCGNDTSAARRSSRRTAQSRSSRCSSATRCSGARQWTACYITPTCSSSWATRIASRRQRGRERKEEMG